MQKVSSNPLISTQCLRLLLKTANSRIVVCKGKATVAVDLKFTEELETSKYGEAGKATLDFSDARQAYCSKTTTDLAKALFVFKMCSFETIVDRNQQLMDISQRLLGQTLFNKIMKKTFFGQFCGGEDEMSLASTVELNSQYGVKAMLHYCVEKESSHGEQSCNTEGAALSLGPARTVIEGLPPVKLWDDYWRDNKTCIDGVAVTTDGSGIAQLKLTGMWDPDHLEKTTSVLREFHAWFSDVCVLHGNEKMISTADLDKHLCSFGIPEETRLFWIHELDSNKDRLIDEPDWTTSLSKSIEFCHLLQSVGQLKTILTENENLYMKELIHSFTVLMKYAENRNVTVALDAEQSWFREGINAIAQEMMSLYNKDSVRIYNTFQCYQKCALKNVRTLLETGKRDGFGVGFKVVRGAYMEQEEERASEEGYENPIHPSYEATNQMYDGVLAAIFAGIQRRPPGSVAMLICSHNERSIEFAVNKMHELGLSPSNKNVAFAQLYGMCDFLTYPIGHEGYNVFKSIPYGPLHETLPYLSRRAYENQSVFDKVQKERQMLWTEFSRRARERFQWRSKN